MNVDDIRAVVMDEMLSVRIAAGDPPDEESLKYLEQLSALAADDDALQKMMQS